MPTFEYQVITDGGKVVKGASSGANEQAVVDALRAEGYAILEVRQQDEQPIAPPTAPPRSFEPFGVPERALVYFTRGFATTLVAGLPLLRALATLRQQTASAGLRRVLADVTARIQQGESLAMAVAHHRRTFSDLFVSMVRVGESTGSLDATVGRLADMMERDYNLRRKVGSALAYPTFVLFFSLVLVYAMMAFLMPGFAPFFEASGIDLRASYPLTYYLMQASAWAGNPLAVGWALVLCLGAGGGVFWALRTERGRLLVDTLKLRTPGVRGMFHTAILVRFCRTFGTLTSSGVPLLESLKLVASASGNTLVARSIGRVSRDVQGGEKISRTLGRVPFFPPLLVQMATVGEETGTLDTLFDRIADYYERDLEAAITTVMSLIEPAMMLFVGGVVCAFVMAVLLPILGMSSAFQG